MNHFSGEELVQYESEVSEEGCEQRAQMILRSMDTMWTSLGLFEMLEIDKQADNSSIDNSPLDNTLVLISPSEFYLRSVYANRALKITMVLNWETQKLFIRIEQSFQSFQSFVISVEDVVKLNGYELSLIQANKVANLYYKDFMKVTRQLTKEDDGNNENNEIGDK